ncbi:MAG: M28 family peptidase, partial [Vicinamibacterales bacterium]
SVERRISKLINEYEAQGFHRTGTAVDRVSGDWLSDQVGQAGLVPIQETFSLDRVDPISNVLVAGDRRIEGLPLFDGAFTGDDGVRGRLGTLESNAEIGLARTAVNATATGALGDARRNSRHQAIVAVTAGRRPGLCPSNADSFLAPFGPPVLQVSSEEAAWLDEHAKRGAEVQLIAHVARTSATAANVIATIEGAAPEAPPLVIMTPRSGWYWCASERGGGIACWLEVMRALRTSRPKRTVLFVASSGHELGHLGINAFIDRRPGIVTKAVSWMHFGASIGAATDSRVTLQASDDELDAALTRVLTSAGIGVDRRNPRGTIPGGEAEAVHREGGRYVSIIGGNALFHNLDDRGPKAIDPSAIARFSTAFIELARTLANAE